LFVDCKIGAEHKSKMDNLRLNKSQRLLDFAMKDSYFAAIIHDLLDYGHRVRYSPFGGAGAYTPTYLSTDPLDSTLKQQQFSNGFWAMSERGLMICKIRLSMFAGEDANKHSFLHEVMHFYQDSLGIYFTPLKEKGRLPVVLDAKSHIVSLLFCEAWAQIEAIRTCWALKDKGDASGWDGLLKSKEWSALALFYDADLESGFDEARAAANCFKEWYRGSYRVMYEKHALDIFETNVKIFSADVKGLDQGAMAASLRCAGVDDIIARIPAKERPKYMSRIEWDNTMLDPQDKSIREKLRKIEARYGRADNNDVSDIRCGSAPYIWKRLRNAEIKESELPPPPPPSED
jgi:hypothetical protein